MASGGVRRPFFIPPPVFISAYPGERTDSAPPPLSPPPPCGQVLFISADPEAYLFQPENTLKLKPWRDDPNDTTLLDLLPMLQV